MSQKKAAENIDLFEGWIARQTNADFKNLVRRGQLNRQEVAQQVGFAKSVLRQNPAVKARLERLEDDLRPIGILPEKKKSSDFRKKKKINLKNMTLRPANAPTTRDDCKS